MNPIIIKYKSTIASNFKLSPSLHRKSISQNNNSLKVFDFLSRNLEKKDLGFEVGSLNYVKNSNYFFIRTKALQNHTFLPEISNESIESIHPKAFKNYNLKKGDILISKDSNIGEIIILDKNYLNYMPSGALYRLPIENRKYYLLAFIKHSFFRNQLDMIVPKGATIRHAGTKFLDCKIPLPNTNEKNIIAYVEAIMKLIIEFEVAIKNKFRLINDIIITELNNGQKKNKFNFEQPFFNNLKESKRLDTGIYSETFKKIDFLIKNYVDGFFFLNTDNFRSGNTPEIRHIGTDSTLKYRWVTPTNCSDIGYLMVDERISMLGENNLNQNAMLLINRTSRGGRGEYVGIAAYYDISVYGTGHHNQGIYRVFNYTNEDLIFMTCFMNTDIMRKYCSFMCVGSKMKELKASQFFTIPFPNFDKKIKSKIVNLYNNETNLNKELSIIFDKPDLYLNKGGLVQLEILLRKLKTKLNDTLEKIIINEKITIDFSV
ncbi:MAG: restriction endonuclease subunit S [Bacteroidales bacterium]|jgi:type I restriction enzyme S subunit